MTVLKTTGWSTKKHIIETIMQNGGWINTHAHIDRSNVVNESNYELYLKGEEILNQLKKNKEPFVEKYLEYKWKLNDDLKRNSTIEDYYQRMARTIEELISQGVSILCTNIDVDKVVEDKVIKAAIRIRQDYKDKIKILYVNQLVYGNLDKEDRYWYDQGAEFVDILGGLPEADRLKPNGEARHLDVIMEAVKKYKKMAHIHGDQYNSPDQKQFRMIAEKAIEWGVEGKIVGVHGVSLAAQEKNYRQETYKIMKDAGMMVIVCPTAWLDSKRSERLMPFHNSCPPVDEFIEEGIVVGLGTDGIVDMYVPWNDGDMWLELRTLTHVCRLSNVQDIIAIATTNSRKVLGLD